MSTMDGMSVLEATRKECETEIDRLGSEKSLIASTDAQLNRNRVLAEAAIAEMHAHNTLILWADDEDDPTAAQTFREVAATEIDHYERVIALADSAPDDPNQSPNSLHKHLRNLEETPVRIGAGLLGRPLVSLRSLLQVINFFINEGNTAAADLFRDLRSETNATLEHGVELLDAVCESNGEYEQARDAAVMTVNVVYEVYTTDLEALGIDPKPIC